MISVSFIFLVIGSDASVSVLWFFHTRSFAVVIVGASFFFTSFENQRQNNHAHTHILVCSHWAIRNCGNSSIQSTEQSWGSAATTRPELLHPSCVASALPPARHLLYRKPTKSNRLYLCSSSARPVLRSIRPRHPTTTTAATFFINPLVTTPSVIVTIITVDACRWVLILTHFILHVCPSRPLHPSAVSRLFTLLRLLCVPESSLCNRWRLQQTFAVRTVDGMNPKYCQIEIGLHILKQYFVKTRHCTGKNKTQQYRHHWEPI